MTPSLCHIFEAIGPYNAIGKVAMSNVQIALDAGYDVTVVAKHLDESLRPHVKWLPLYVPPRGFLLQWTTARHFIKRALGNRQFDIIHSHQPQAASLSNVFQCHFLTRVAYERKCLEERKSLRARAVRLQQQGVLYAEDYYYRHWNPDTLLLFVSNLLRDEFTRLYGAPPASGVLSNACPPLNLHNSDQRRAARKKLLGRDHPGPVVGYIGGLQERKGYRRILQALKDAPDVFFLMGGQHTAGFSHPDFSNRMAAVGLVGDTNSFYAACDVVLVPSYFDPCPLVVFEAACAGTPVVVTPGVGNADDLLSHGAGEIWNEPQPLAPLVRSIAATRERYLLGIRSLASALSLQSYARHLLAVYDRVLARRTAPLLIAS